MTNPKIKNYLDRLVESENRPNSYIFAGAGENEIEEEAFYFISKLSLQSDAKEFLNRVKAKNHPDVIIIEPEVEEKKGKKREKEIRIFEIQQALERIKFFPYELKKKFCVIKKAQRMNIEAANALLKSLEEPSESAIFILLAENMDLLLPTIVSRCAALRFPQTQLPKWNEENRDKLKNIFKEDIFERFDYVDKISKNKNEMISILRDWEMVMAESLRNLVSGGESQRKIGKVVELITSTRDSINRLERTNANARGVGEELMLEMG